MTTAQIANYQTGKIVIERAFTSTSIGGVGDLFVGNVEFTIVDANGAGVLGLAGRGLGAGDKNEVLLSPASFFRVISVELDTDSGSTNIKLQQVN